MPALCLRPHFLDGLWHLARENEEYAKVLIILGRSSDATRHLERAIALYRDVRTQEPDAMSDQRALAVGLDILGTYVTEHGEWRRGRSLIEESLAIAERAALSDSASVRTQKELSTIRSDLAKATERFSALRP